tara:strand:+ start:638 stop:1087 length:450 start_codon:yes stop_codon:yes gene_type:complete
MENFLQKKITVLISASIFTLIFFLLPSYTFSAPINGKHIADSATGKALNKLGTIGEITGLGKLDMNDDPSISLYYKIASIVNILIGLAGIIATIFIIVAGLKWIMAGGNEEQIKSSKDTIKSSVIGIIIIFAAFVLVNFVINNLIDVFI